jgi:hypothetical protein
MPKDIPIFVFCCKTHYFNCGISQSSDENWDIYDIDFHQNLRNFSRAYLTITLNLF